MEGAWWSPAHSSRCTASPRAHCKNTKILFSCFSVSKHRFSASPPSRAARLHEAPEGAHCRNTADSGFSTLLGTKIPVNPMWFPPTCGARCRVHTALSPQWETSAAPGCSDHRAHLWGCRERALLPKNEHTSHASWAPKHTSTPSPSVPAKRAIFGIRVSPGGRGGRTDITLVLTPSDGWVPFQGEGARTQGEEGRAEAGVGGARGGQERQPREPRTRKVWNLQRECGPAHTLMPHSSLLTERARCCI